MAISGMEYMESKGSEHAGKAEKGTENAHASHSFPVSTVDKSAKDRIIEVVGWGVLFIGLFLILSNLPIFSAKPLDPNTGLIIVFVTGLLTSLHCVGMCSGFVVSYASNSKGIAPHLCYNGSRLLSYVALGALLGLVGSVFAFTDQLRSYMAILAGLFMVAYGASLFYPPLRRFVSLPGIDPQKHGKNNPTLIGLMNGFMPCGPLQAMLMYAAASGNALQGGLVMAVFGLGTVPLMLLMGATISVISMRWTNKIVKVAGMLVIVLGIILLGRGLMLSGIALPFMSSASAAPVTASSMGPAPTSPATAGFQVIDMNVTPNGWQPNHFVVKKGIPVKWNVYVKQLSGCVHGIKAPGLGISYYFQSDGETKTFEFTPTQTGTIYFTCSMGMVSGSIDVVDDTAGAQTG